MTRQKYIHEIMIKILQNQEARKSYICLPFIIPIRLLLGFVTATPYRNNLMLVSLFISKKKHV